MIRRSTWIFLSAFVVVLAGAILWSRSKPGPEGAGQADATPTAEPLWSVPSTDIVGLRLEDLQTGLVVEVRRGDEQTPWRMTAPVEGPADAARVEWAVNSLLSPRPRGTLPAPADLAPFGLAEPSRRVTVFLRDDVARSFEIGRISPTGGVFYVAVPGRPEIVLLNEYSLTDALSLLDDLPYPPTATPGEALPPSVTATLEPTGN
jgi:hypothetical protein